MLLNNINLSTLRTINETEIIRRESNEPVFKRESGMARKSVRLGCLAAESSHFGLNIPLGKKDRAWLGNKAGHNEIMIVPL
ncbi:hypothetical protein K0M31_003972 [Melipona bicolor]|uniref:Uncharacterized protein n=1 Tax=Melipona bicolor TaxID=60889 RepID=A0AA40FXW4_9HYME|nr:hypothetical protein K0M31_003972 [Melipona bicolor]